MKELERQCRSGSSNIPSVMALPLKNRSRLLMLGEIDSQVKEYVLKPRAAGGVVNSAVAMAVMCGIVFSHDRTLLEENGGYLKITNTLLL